MYRLWKMGQIRGEGVGLEIVYIFFYHDLFHFIQIKKSYSLLNLLCYLQNLLVSVGIQ